MRVYDAIHDRATIGRLKVNAAAAVARPVRVIDVTRFGFADPGQAERGAADEGDAADGANYRYIQEFSP
jgi:hypothetical protein